MTIVAPAIGCPVVSSTAIPFASGIGVGVGVGTGDDVTTGGVIEVADEDEEPPPPLPHAVKATAEKITIAEA